MNSMPLNIYYNTNMDTRPYNLSVINTLDYGEKFFLVDSHKKIFSNVVESLKEDTRPYNLSVINTLDYGEKFFLVDSHKKIFSNVVESLKGMINPLLYLLRNVDSYKETLLNIIKDLTLVGIVSINKDLLNKYKSSFAFIQEKKYDVICEDASDMLKMATHQICEIESVDSEQRKILKNFFKEIHCSKEIALGRVEKDKLDSDKKILYSLCAIEHILGAVLDEEFFELTGGYKMPRDFIEFGRNLIDIS